MILASSTTSMTLPNELIWLEELSWTFKKVRGERSVGGKMIRTVSTAIGGKPVTLQSPENGLGAVSRSAIQTLQGMVEADLQMVLTFADGSSINVLFRHDPEAIDAHPAMGFTNRVSTERWHVTIRLQTV